RTITQVFEPGKENTFDTSPSNTARMVAPFCAWMSIPLLFVVTFHSLCFLAPKLPTIEAVPVTGIGNFPLFAAKVFDNLKVSVEAVVTPDSMRGATVVGDFSFSSLEAT